MTEAAPPAAVRVWDLPIRVFHGCLALAVVALVATARVGGNAMEWHFRLGYVVFALLLFRLLWGFAGSRWARFSSFAYGPRALARHVRGRPSAGDAFEIGHSPLGALSVFAMLAVLAAQVGTGLVSWDDIVQIGGPLNRYVSESTAGSALWYHEAVGQWLVIGLVGLHLAAVLFYLVVRRCNLISPMWHGDKALADAAMAANDGPALRWRALVLMFFSAGVVAAIVAQGG